MCWNRLSQRTNDLENPILAHVAWIGLGFVKMPYQSSIYIIVQPEEIE